MAKRSAQTKAAKRPRTAAAARPRRGFKGWIGLIVLRSVTVFVAGATALIFLYTVVNPPTTWTMFGEKRRLGALEHEWVAMENIAPVMARSAVAAEDADFCLHWGFDMSAIRAAIEAGGARGGSTITQQVVKNVFLWQGRSWPRKALEAVITPAVEAVWSKRRILEVYLNVAEMGEGVFGVKAAARHHFGVEASELTPRQAALIAAILPAPKRRSPGSPSRFVSNRAAQIMDGAALIRSDGRASCFED